jgi:hypothetical protein
MSLEELGIVINPEDILAGNKLYVVSPHSGLPADAILSVNGDVLQEGGPVLLVRYPFHDSQGSLFLVPVLGVHPGGGGSSDTMCLTLTGPAGTRLRLENHQEYPVVFMDSEGIPVDGGASGTGPLLAVFEPNPLKKELFAVDQTGEVRMAGVLTLGRGGKEGGLSIRNKNDWEMASFDAATGTLEVGKHPDTGGRINVWGGASPDGEMVEGISLNGPSARLGMGGGGQSAHAELLRSDDSKAIVMDARRSRISLSNSQGTSVVLDGEKGNVVLAGGDCAEEFATHEEQTIEPGRVVVMNDVGEAVPCSQAYDKRVLGIVSGARGLKPGVVLKGGNPKGTGAPIALTGKAYCYVDASFGAISAGDLLTTSPTRGHAMLADEQEPLTGRLVGKAMAALDKGRGLVLTFVGCR